MELPARLNKLNFHRQKTIEEEEIKNTREDIISLIKQSLVTGLFKRFRTNSDLFDSNIPKNRKSLLTNNSNQRRLDIFEAIIKYSDVIGPNISIPSTLVRNGNLPVSFLVQTIKNGKVIAIPCKEEEYFNIEIERCLEDDENAPIYIYKALNKEVELMYSHESAKTAWIFSKEPTKMQHYIQSSSIVRVIWLDGTPAKYFTIPTNLKKPRRGSITEPKATVFGAGCAQKRRASVFDYRTLLKKSSQSINNPFKVKNEIEPVVRSNKKRRSQSFSYSTPEEFYASFNPTNEKNKLLVQLNKDDNNEFLANSKNIENALPVESNEQFPEISTMTGQIIEFLNKCMFKEDNIKGIVLDFIQNRDKKWFLLKCKEFSNSLNTSFSKVGSLKTPEPKKISFRKQRTISSDLSNAKAEESIFQVPDKDLSQNDLKSQRSLARLYRNKSTLKPIPLAEIPEKELFYRRCSKVNETQDKIANEQSEMKSKEAQKSLLHGAGSSPMSCPFKFSRNKNLIINKPAIDSENAKNPSFSIIVDAYAKKHLNTTADNLDEINLYTQVVKVKSENLVEKYGGSQFWDQFIYSIWNKVLENKLLSKYFKDAKLEVFKMIVNGMFNLFNGTINPMFRRRLRAAHQHMGLSEKEFSNFSDIYENTLIEFQISEFDKGIMMAQIKSLRTLICKQGI